jgi:FkbM family methyltransferase
MNVYDFNNIVFIGAGQAAEWIYAQTKDIETKLKAVGDLLNDTEREKDSFHGVKITHVSNLTEWITREDTAMVVAIGHFDMDLIVKSLICDYHLEKTRLFVPNPYVSLRTFGRNEDFINGCRMEFDDKSKNILMSMFSDDVSKRIWRELTDAVPWDKPGDYYDLKWYPDIEQVYYKAEYDYWKSYEFPDGLEEKEATVFDCGAYTGDSVEPICSSIPQKKVFYYAFEPLADNIKDINKNPYVVKMGEYFKTIACGVGNENTTCEYVIEDDPKVGKFVKNPDEYTYLSGVERTVYTLKVQRLDDLKLDIHGQLYIKMDVEGSELNALKGAENLIKKERPIMAVCLYHKKNDYMQIPLYINSIVDEYCFYLRGGYHTILWAIPKEFE